MPDLTDLAAIRARVAAATPGPWYVGEPLDRAPTVRGDQHGASGLYVCETRTAYDGLTVGPAEQKSSEADADLIAHAPTDLLALCAEVERLREALHDTMAALGSPRDEPTCGYAQVATTALAAERERALCDALAWAWYEIGDGDHRDKGGFDPGRDEFVAAGLIAIRAITPAPGAADTSTEAP